MPSQLSMSTGMTVAQLEGIIDAFDAAGGAQLRIFAGTMPSSANAGVGSATLLATVKKDGTDELELEVDGVLLTKPAADVWSATYVAAGTPSFFRLVGADDTNAASTTLPRLQGTVGRIDSDLNLSTSAAVVSEPVAVREFIYGLREAVQG